MKLPKHKAALFISHNEHKNYYQTAAECADRDPAEWKSEEQKKRAIQTDEIWTMQWYPETPIGFHVIAAPTLEELIEFANELDNDIPTNKSSKETLGTSIANAIMGILPEEPEGPECPYCGGVRQWCAVCQCWASVCCIPFGTCQCS